MRSVMGSDEGWGLLGCGWGAFGYNKGGLWSSGGGEVK